MAQVNQTVDQIRYGLIKEVNFITIFFKKWLKNNNIKMYLMYSESKRVIAERFIGTLKNKIYENVTAVSKND